MLTSKMRLFFPPFYCKNLLILFGWVLSWGVYFYGVITHLSLEHSMYKAKASWCVGAYRGGIQTKIKKQFVSQIATPSHHYACPMEAGALLLSLYVIVLTYFCLKYRSQSSTIWRKYGYILIDDGYSYHLEIECCTYSMYVIRTF